ncbi:MAG: hypothetical protein J4G12_09360 [Gemmatimonadetes bacterium]|nr:hypothetical protein [Gemmatimonadota bacterium]
MKRTSNPLRHLAAAVAVGALLVQPPTGAGSAVSAQEREGEDVVSHEEQGRLLLTVAGRSTRIRSQARILVGGDLRVRLPSSFTAGLGIWASTASTAVPGGSTGVDYQMDFAYGGVVLERSLLQVGGMGMGARFTFGAGAARMSLPRVSGYSAADNFGVAEGEAVISRQLRGVELRAQLGYRLPFGVEDLPQTAAEHFQGFSASLGVALGPW